jgi:monoamine oxidase
MTISRREFIARVARAGGYGAAFMTMHSLGLLGVAESERSQDFPLPSSAGRGTKVIILGAGIAGLVSAYEMRRAGFDCTVLEARERPGGRNWTLRGGSRLVFTDGTTQTCGFDEGNYFNSGPARLPSIHKTILGYCNELGVALEVEVNSSRRSLLQNDGVFGGAPIRQGQAVNDSRGHIAELLAKCVQQGALDQAFSKEDHEALLEFLKSYGALKADYQYRGSARSGDQQMPGAGDQKEIPREPLALSEILRSKFCRPMLFEEALDMQPTMFQPVGGMDRIAYAFAAKLGDIVRYNSPITEIRKTASGVRVSYPDKGGKTISLEAPYCICTLPVPVLKNVPNDFSTRVKMAMEQVTYDSAYKVAWESRRFWEQDGDEIYGGLSWLTSGPVSTVWYPSAGLMSRRGVLISGYSMENYDDFGKLPSTEAKIAASRAAVEKLHPGKSKELQKPLYMCWGKVPYSLGSWVSRGPDYPPVDEEIYYDGPYREFIVPDDRIYFAGDHCSRIIGWQEGAALAARRAIAMIVGRVNEG